MGRPLQKLQQFFRELKRRNVYRVAVTYAVVAFIVWQVASLLFPALQFPAWTIDFVIVLTLLGFPLAVVLAWAFEVTPEGVRRTAEVGPEELEAAGGGNRTIYKVLVGIGLVAAAVAGGWYLTGGGSATPEPTVPGIEGLESSRVAVFPFAVRSGEGLSDWSEGMVELLGRSLDGAGSLRAVDPNTLLSRIEAEPGEGVHADSARRIAARFGAGRYVLGSIYELGDRLRVSGTWYRTDGGTLGSADVTGVDEGGIQRMVDSLARSAIADLTDEAGERRQRLAAQTTSSADALKAYLDGQRAFRRWDFSAAIDAYSKAVERDSTFALAHYRLSLAAGWSGRDLHLAQRAARRAVELSGDLPERDRRLLRAYYAFGTGEADRAERLYRLLVQSHPEDLEAWYMLGETLIHYNAVRGRPLTESRGPLRRALELDPGAGEPRVHLAHLALLERDTARLDSLTGAFGDQTVYGLGAVSQVVHGGSNLENIESAFRPLQSRDQAHALVGVHGLSLWDEQAAYEAVEPWTRVDRPEELRASALLIQADLLATQGKLEAARKKVRVIAPLDSAAYWVGRSQLAILPYLPESETNTRERRDVLQGLQVWNANDVPERVVTLYLNPRDVYPAGRLYLIGLLHAQAGDREEALRTADQLEARDPSLLAASAPADFARSIRAEVSRQRNRPEKALPQLEAADSHVSMLLLFLRLHSSARERYLRAQLLADQGRLEEALRWYRTFTGLSWGERPYLGPARLGQARVLERLGRTEEATRQYRRFIDAWTDADEELQPRVDAARERLQQLTASQAEPDE